MLVVEAQLESIQTSLASVDDQILQAEEELAGEWLRKVLILGDYTFGRIASWKPTLFY